MKTIFITIAEDIIGRNIFHTSFWKIFEPASNSKVVFLVPPDRVEYYKRIFSNTIHEVCAYTRPPLGRVESLINTLARSGINTKTNLWSKMRSYYRGDSSLVATCIKRCITRMFGNSRVYKKIIRKALMMCVKDSAARALFDKYSPCVLLAFSLTNFDFDVMIAREAKKRRVPILGMVRSWDNFSSHGLLRVVPDTLYVQNDFLEEMAVTHQDISPRTIIKVGVPHYDDVYNIQTKMCTRESFCAKYGLHPDSKIILYAAMGQMLFIREGDLPQCLNTVAAHISMTQPIEVLYREHPKFIFKDAKDSLPFVHFSSTPMYIDHTKGELHHNENMHLLEMLYHSDVVVTGASSIAIDAAILDKPIVCVAFDGDAHKPPLPYWESAQRFYDHYTHFEELVKTGGVSVAYSVEELQQYILRYLADASADKKGRYDIVKRFVGNLDGRAGYRLAQHLISDITKL